MSDMNDLCLVNLIVADRNDDGQLSLSEYKEFATLLGFPQGEELPSTLEARFYSLACLCADSSTFDGQAEPSTCCNDENVVINLSLARQSSEYLGNVCSWTESSIAVAMESFFTTASPSSPAPTIAKPSSTPTLRPSPSASVSASIDAVSAFPSSSSPTSAMTSSTPTLRRTSRPSVQVSASINAVSAAAPGNDHSGLSRGALTAVMCVAAIGFIIFFVFGLVFSARRQRRKWIERDGIDDSGVSFYRGSNINSSISSESNGQNGSKSRKGNLNASKSVSLSPIAENDENRLQWPTYTYLP